MGRIADLMPPEWAERELASRFGDGLRAKLHSGLTQGLLRSIGDQDVEARWGNELRACKTRVALEYAAGADAATLRAICRSLVERFAREVVPALDFSIQKIRVDGGKAPSDARELAETFGGTWWKDGRYAGVEYRAMRQPFSLHIHEMWEIAAVAGDRELAERVAKPYQLRPPEQIRLRYEVRRAILRYALAGDAANEQILAERLEPGYMAGFPPPLIEFPLAVHRRDPKLLAGAMRKMTTHFKGKWHPKKHRDFYDKQVQRYGHSRWRSPGTWEAFLDRSRSALVGSDYVVSWWALAWLNIARWRGMTQVLENAKLYSEWVPQSLCEHCEQRSGGH